MALGNYTEIVAAYREASGDESTSSTQIEVWIALAELRMNRSLRVAEMETTTTITPVAGVGTLPTDFLEERRLRYTGTPQHDLEKAAYDSLIELSPTFPAGIPYHYAISGLSFYLDKSSTTNISLTYYQKIPALSSGSPTNWVTEKAPDLYYYGILVEYAVQYSDDAALARYGRLWQEGADQLTMTDKGKRFSGVARNVRRGATP
jgi:hypothetical protein